MPSDDQKAQITIPEELKKQYPDIIDLIQRSESMNAEEQQYWVNIMPVMTPEQIQSLRDILTNERQQLDEIDKKYASEINKVGEETFMKKVAEERDRRRTERSNAEQAARGEEQEKTEDILNKIDSL